LGVESYRALVSAGKQANRFHREGAMKRALFVIAAPVLAAGFPGGSLGAQDTSRFPSRLIPRVSVAGAFDARNNGRGDDEMYLGLTALEWDTNVPRLAVRVDGIYARRDWFQHQQPLPGFPGNTAFAYQTSKVTAAGAMTGVTYAFRGIGSLRPYALASAGVMKTNDRNASGTAIICPACSITRSAIAPAETLRRDKPLTGAGQIGVGALYSFSWVSVLAETRYMTVGYEPSRGLNGAVPLSLGMRFGPW
jgi:hypothetical protein